MRLSVDQTRVILHCVHQQFGADAQVMLFGSRLDDTARGGDVDLLVESQTTPTLRQRALATMALEQALNLPVDIVACSAVHPAARLHAWRAAGPSRWKRWHDHQCVVG